MQFTYPIGTICRVQGKPGVESLKIWNEAKLKMPSLLCPCVLGNRMVVIQEYITKEAVLISLREKLFLFSVIWVNDIKPIYK